MCGHLEAYQPTLTGSFCRDDFTPRDITVGGGDQWDMICTILLRLAGYRHNSYETAQYANKVHKISSHYYSTKEMMNDRVLQVYSKIIS